MDRSQLFSFVHPGNLLIPLVLELDHMLIIAPKQRLKLAIDA